MSKFKLKIVSQGSFVSRLFNSFPKILSHVFSTFLILVTMFFVLEKLVPIINESNELEQLIQLKQKELYKHQEKLFQIKLAGPFTRQWRPKHYLQFADLCSTDTLAYKKLTLLNKNSDVFIHSLDVKKEKNKTVGFDFSLDVLGTYSEVVKFLTNVEDQFSFFQIKSMDLSPESAEKRYMGLLQFHLEGWLW
jgi:hypothetical protein